MLAFVYRLVAEFKHEHGMHPNLLYLNPEHARHLQAALDAGFSYQSMVKLLRMELVINTDTIHPRVAWAQSAARIAV